MSSTSCSSEYDCHSWQYGNYRSVRTPIYSTMAYPLVYQVQVPPPPRGHKYGERKKNNPNCFVKAFRWYTQELVPQTQTVGSPKTSQAKRSPDVASFADWLDSKYEAFLMENQDQNGHCIKLTQTSTIEAEAMLNDVCQPCMPCTSKRFARGKRPNKSLIYLLEPKELPRHGSQCCHPNPTSCCSETVVVCKKYVVKSQSETKVSKYMEIQPIDAATMQEGAQIKDRHQEISKHSLKNKLGDDAVVEDKPQEAYKHSLENIIQSSKIKEEVPALSLKNQNVTEQKKTASEEKETLKIVPKQTLDSIETKSKKPKEDAERKIAKLAKDIYCQCSKESVGIDAQTQYEESNQNTTAPQVSNSKPVTCCPCPGCYLHCTNTQTIIKGKRLAVVRTPNTTPKCSKFSSRSNDASCQYGQDTKSDGQNQYCLACECASDTKRVCCENRCGLEATQQVVTREKVQSRCSFSCPSRTRASVSECKTRSTCCSLLVNENVQTSDHSIILDANTVHGYPLFMKIVCADKLYDDCQCQKKLLIN